MRLWDQGIDDNDGGAGILRRSRRLSNDYGGFGKIRGINIASKGSDSTTEAAGARRRAKKYMTTIEVSAEEISTKTTKVTTKALTDIRRRVQGIRDDNASGSGSMTVLVY